MTNKISRPISAAVLACILAAAAQAQTAAPDSPVRPGMQPLGETVADRPSAVYRFETHRLDSDDGKRHYRIQIAIPRNAPEAGGSPALYMLDGNAALATLTPADLDKLGQGRAPVLVALGYDVATRNDVVSRAYDYTPPVFEHGKPVPGPVVRGRVGGGADVFLEFIRAKVKPLVRERAAIDLDREYLWGHSYGGLFTLHVLFTQPQAFARYVVGDPSAWWHDGALVKEWRQFDARKAAGKRVAVLVGTKPRDPGRPQPGGAEPAAGEDPRAAVREMAQGLKAAGADATYEAFPQFGHGEMIRASLERALEVAVQP
ncbi:MAG: alpha/beta hydrolase-fold protein [Achromobacter sp.]|uniref:alpha/beta hydrolase n=1 Tax=Achromobacter sp. TaxID=134375 RepID=UPI00258D45D8|nr:alpha/beta hydrolase-fold protein [Achromobacter sp.]MCW0209220.1 alpha/beta hydrolase-fold protein [Achromobacter sp.]